MPLLLVAGLVLAACGGSNSSSASSTTAATTAATTSIHSGSTSRTKSHSLRATSSKTTAKGHPSTNRFAHDAGLAFGAFHRWIYKPFKAGDFSHPQSHQAEVSKAIGAATYVAKEVGLAQHDAASSKALSKLVPTLKAIATTINVLPSGLASKSPVAATVDAAAINYVNGKITSVEAAARAAGFPITEMTAGANF